MPGGRRPPGSHPPVESVKEVGISPVIAYNGFRMANNESEQQPSKKQGGDHTAGFLKAFDEYSDALFRHAIYRLSDRERAIELVHDTFTKAWSYIRSGHEIESYKSFLYKVLGNLIIDEYRRRRELSLDMLLAEEGTDEGSFEELHEHSIDELTFALDAKKALELLETLPVVYKEVLTLRFVDGLGPKEISMLIEESENVVSVRIHRGLKLLREQIEAAEKAAFDKLIK